MKKFIIEKMAARIAAGGAASLALLVQTAQAAVPTEVTTAITSAGTDLQTVAVAIIAAMAAFWGIKAIGTKLGLWK